MTLRLEGVTVRYGDAPVLRQLDLVVPSGSTVALLGTNGAGKTTTLKAIGGLVRLSAGRILRDGIRIDRLPVHERAVGGLCLIPEGRGIFPPLSVRENLQMFARGKAVSERLDRAISIFPRLGERLDQRAQTLSGGEQQMLALAHAVLERPDIVMVDELSLGLAPVIIDELFTVLSRLKSDGTSLLIVEQYANRVLDIADFAYVLNRGRAVFRGTAEECRRSGVFDQYLGDSPAPCAQEVS